MLQAIFNVIWALFHRSARQDWADNLAFRLESVEAAHWAAIHEDRRRTKDGEFQAEAWKAAQTSSNHKEDLARARRKHDIGNMARSRQSGRA